MNPNKIKQTEIDRLVDGSLGGDQYRKMIQRLDSSPGGWKQCALTFLEQQALARDFGEIINASGNDVTAGMLPAESESAKKSLNAEDPMLRNPARKWVGIFLAAAASFMMAFFLGIGAQQWFENPPMAKDDSKVMGDNMTPVSDTLPLVVRDNHSGQQKQFDIPLVNSVGRDNDLTPAIRGQLPEQVDRLIQDVNVPYEVRRNMVSLMDEKGTVYYVPVDQVKFGRSLGQYQ